MDRTEVRIRNRLEDMPAVVTMVESFGAEHRIPASVIGEINLVLDEVLSNIISYGYAESQSGNIVVRLGYGPGEIRVEICDDARPFDPLRVGPPDLSGTVQTRSVGGVGLLFVRELMDDLVYDHVGNGNRLLLKKKVPV